MRYYEITNEARKNHTVNNQRNGASALFFYLRRMGTDALRRSYIHFSMSEKLGIKPYGVEASDPFEPVGIFTYPASRWLFSRGRVDYAGNYPIAKVITIKESDFTVYNKGSEDEPHELYAMMADKYPEIGDGYGRAKTTKYLLDHGYNLINTNAVKPAETVILNPKAIEKVKTFIIQFIRPNEKAGYDPSNGNLEWAGPGADLANASLHKNKEFLKDITDKKILSHKEEYDLLYAEPLAYKEYTDKVLTSLGLKSKLTAADIESIDKKHKASASRRPASNEYSNPTFKSAERLLNHGKNLINQGRQLSKDQETNLVRTGGNPTGVGHYARDYYKLLAQKGLHPLLTAADIKGVSSSIIGYPDAWEDFQKLFPDLKK
jgi:hypothetical protein